MTEPTIDLAQKITITYDEAQDRLLWVLALNPENTQSRSYWVTQRMSRRLIETLISWIEKNTKKPVGLDSNVIQGWEQAAAQQQFQPSEGVTWQAHQQALASTIDISFNQEIIHIIFKDGEKPTCLSLKELELRHILNILYTTFQKADWPTDVWPNWITGSTDVPHSQKTALH